MSILKNLEDYLKGEGVEYEINIHSEAYTAQEIAARQHVPGRMLAKVVILKSGEQFIMVVISANCKIDFLKAKERFKVSDIRLATEEEFQDLFPGCEVGAMPPFGNLYDMKVYVGQEITQNEYMVFNAGNHVETVKMKYSDFERLVNPEHIEICAHV
jgi:Ala-tRNA(Pro) deacylase